MSVAARFGERWSVRHAWPLLPILLVAAGLRIPGIPHELPYLYAHDEVSTVETALRFGTGTLQPYSFGHGPLMAYLMAAIYGAYYGWLRLLDRSVTSQDEFILGYLADPTPFYLIHRGFTVALGLGFVVLAYLVARRLFTPRAGVVAALLAAFANVLLVLSVAGREDMLYLSLVMLGVYASIPIYEGRGTRGSWLTSGAFMGLATSAKYFGVFGLLFPLLALWGQRDRFGRGVRWVLGGFAGGLLVGMPGALLEVRALVADVLKLALQTSGASYGVSPFEGFAYPTVHLANAVGKPLQVMFFLSAVILFVKERRAAVYLLTPPLAFLAALVTRSGNQAHYYVAFAVPFLCVAVARVVDRAMALPAQSRWPGWVLGSALVAVVLWPNVAADLRYLEYLSMPDTRNVAKTWIERNIPSGSVILIETRASDFGIRLGPPLRESVGTLRRELSEIRRRGGSGKLWEYKILRALQDGTGARYELVKVHTVRPDIVDAHEWGFVVASATPDSDARKYRSLSEHATLLAIFPSIANFPGDVLATMEELAALPPPRRLESWMRGPAVSVWKRKPPHG